MQAGGGSASGAAPGAAGGRDLPCRMWWGRSPSPARDGCAEQSCLSLGVSGSGGTAQSLSPLTAASDGAGEGPAQRLGPSAGIFSFLSKS